MTAIINSYKDLNIWQKSMELVGYLKNEHITPDLRKCDEIGKMLTMFINNLLSKMSKNEVKN